MLSCSVVWTLYNPMDYSLPGSSVHGDLPGKSTGVDCHALLQGIFLTQGSNPYLLCPLHWPAGSLPLAPPGKPIMMTTCFNPICHYSYWFNNSLFNVCNPQRDLGILGIPRDTGRSGRVEMVEITICVIRVKSLQ